MILWQLFISFCKTGLFAVGGGLATLPFLSDMAAKTGWFTEAELVDMVAVAESTPGPIGVNMATFVGYRTAGLAGAFAATVGLVFPSLLIILCIAAFLKNFRENPYVNAVFRGLRPASAALIAAAGLSLARTVFFADGGTAGVKSLLLALTVLFFSCFCERTKHLHPLVFILFSAFAGIVLQM